MLERPHEREASVVRRGRDGTYRQAADGLIVRVAAAEPVGDVLDRHRVLLELAVRDAVAQGSAWAGARHPTVDRSAPADRAAVFIARTEGNAGRTNG